MKAILDASPLIAFFDELEEPDVLLLSRKLGYELLVPNHVWLFDVSKDPAKALLSKCIESGDIATLPECEPAKVERFMNLHPSLGAGESEAILTAIQFKSAGFDTVCILDERPARHIAQQSGIPIMGTIGIINALMKAGLISGTQVSELKEKLAGSKFRVERRLLR